MINDSADSQKGYVVSLPSEIPKEWLVDKLGYYINEKSIKNKTSQNYKVVSVTKYDGIVDSLSYFKKSVYSNDLSNYKIIKKGQFAYSPIHLNEGSIGYLTIYEEAILSPMYKVFEIDEKKLNRDYLYLLLKTQRYIDLYNRIGMGSVDRRASVSIKNFKNILITIPPLSEQKKITSILSKVDEQIEQTEQIIEKAEILKKGLMQKLLTKGIGHTKFKKTELGDIPEEWSIVKMQTLIDKNIIFPNQDGNHGELHPKSSDYVIEGIPFIMANNLLKTSVDLINCKKISLEQANSLRIKPAIKGDILTSHKGTIGRTAIVQDSKYPFVVLTPQVTYYRIKDADKLYPLYLYYIFQSQNFQKMMYEFSKQSTRNFISISTQRKLSIIFPESVKEQQKIASILSKVDSQIQDNHNYLNQLQELKKGLMQDLLTGKVRVCV